MTSRTSRGSSTSRTKRGTATWIRSSLQPTTHLVVKTVIVGPATIYGLGRGVGNKDSQQVYRLSRFILQKGFGPIIGTGKVEWDNVHIHDVTNAFLLLGQCRPGSQQEPEPRDLRSARLLLHSWRHTQVG